MYYKPNFKAKYILNYSYLKWEVFWGHPVFDNLLCQELKIQVKVPITLFLLMYFKFFRLAVNALYFLTHSSDAYFNQADMVEPLLHFWPSHQSIIKSLFSIKLLIITLLIWLFLATHRTYCSM